MKFQKIYRNQWLRAHPRAPQRDTDQWYVDFANRLNPVLAEASYMRLVSPDDHLSVSLFLTWYLEDCVNDRGCWRQFINLHHKRYGRYLPFYDLTDRYMADEVNREDVCYLLWTLVSVTGNERREPLNPYNEMLIELVDEIYPLIEEGFEQAPITDCDTTDWLMDDILPLEQESTPSPVLREGEKYSPDVENFLIANGGEQLMYLADYAELCRFFVDGLKWEDKEEELMPELCECDSFVLYANSKGLLIAPNIAPFFCDDRNPVYDKERVMVEGFDLFYVEGYCPYDLLRYAMVNGLLPEVAFDFADGKRLLHENWDFIARRYLGEYYEGD